jgi:hypothetical protein
MKKENIKKILSLNFGWNNILLDFIYFSTELRGLYSPRNPRFNQNKIQFFVVTMLYM